MTNEPIRQGRLIEPTDLIFEAELEVGNWTFDKDDQTILIVMPDGKIAGLPLSPEAGRKFHDGSHWNWDGNRDAPTITPSILDVVTGWHGYMRAGQLESV